MLVPQPPADDGQAPVESEVPEEAMERLAHLEQLVVQLKELIRDKDTQLVQKDTELVNKDAQLKVHKLCFVATRILVQRSSRIRTFFMQTLLGLNTHCAYSQNEKEEAEARFTKLKLQAKAKMAALNKQITELKGQGATVSLNDTKF